MSSEALTVKPVTGAIGAEVSGVDLAEPVDAETQDALYQALLDHQVLFFHDQDLSPDDLLRLGGAYGAIEEEPFIPPLEGHPGVYMLKGAEEKKLTTQNLNWHVDHSYWDVPTKAIMLYAIDVPVSGNDTLFANMYLAYDDLSDAMQSFFSGLHVVHDVLQYGMASGHHSVATEAGMGRLVGMRSKYPQVTHPLICTHPDTGRKYVYYNPAWASGIAELSAAEGRRILDFLNEHTLQPRFQCRFRWQNKALAFWDNRCIQHSPIPDHYGRRIMHRVAIGTDWRPA